MTPEENTAYARNGYHIENGLVPDDETVRLLKEAAAVCRGDRGTVTGLTDIPHNADDQELLKSILPIHFPHKISVAFTRFLGFPPITRILCDLIGPNVKCMQSLLFVKSPGMPGQAWHQDEIPIPTRDRSLTGVWVALDDATVANGCLWVIPGSHEPGVLYERAPHDDPRYDGTPQAQRFPHAEADAVPVEMARGSVLFFNGYLLHRSLDNTSAHDFRRSLVMHYMSAESYLPWRGVVDYRDIIMVAGSDPYEHKGVVDESRPFVRNAVR